MQNSIKKLILDNNWLTPKEFLSVVKSTEMTGQTVLTYLSNHKLLSPENIVDIGRKVFNSELVKWDNIDILNLPLDKVPFKLIQESKAIPVKKNKNQIDLAMIDPGDLSIIERFQFQTGCAINPFIAQYDEIEKIIHSLSCQNHLSSLSDLKTKEKTDDLVVYENNDEPIIRFVNTLFDDALKRNASDIHLEVFEKNCRIRFRQDGIMQEINCPPKHTANRMIARIKIMAHLDISEKRFPQDGRIKKGALDIRVSTCPTLFGEKIVLRLLTQNLKLREIKELGFLPAQEEKFLHAIQKPQGLILVTGPTGSGKTNTLYSALSYLNIIEKNILTVEDPIEIVLPGINQVNIHEKINLSFANILRAFLRQDPDIIMIGEIRDSETAEIAIRAAETGHLVLSTLHTNSAAEAIGRLENLGISRYNIAHCVNLITAQRLLRQRCARCENGCKHCSGGFSGRLAIHEVIEIDDNLKHQIINKAVNLKMSNFISLRDSGLKKILESKTTASEIDRILG